VDKMDNIVCTNWREKMTDYNEAEWDAKIEAAAAAGDEDEVERLMLAQQDAFLEANPL